MGYHVVEKVTHCEVQIPGAELTSPNGSNVANAFDERSLTTVSVASTQWSIGLSRYCTRSDSCRDLPVTADDLPSWAISIILRLPILMRLRPSCLHLPLLFSLMGTATAFGIGMLNMFFFGSAKYPTFLAIHSVCMSFVLIGLSAPLVLMSLLIDEIRHTGLNFQVGDSWRFCLISVVCGLLGWFVPICQCGSVIRTRRSRLRRDVR